MKKRKRILFSAFFCLLVLLILWQQEREKTKDLIGDLAGLEMDNDIFEAHNFATKISATGTPLFIWTQQETIKELFASRCQLRINVFLHQANGYESVFNCYGDAGIIQYEVTHGGKIIEKSPEEEKDYFKKIIIPDCRVLCFSTWEIIFYFFQRLLLVSIFTVLPLFFSLKLFVLMMGVIIFIITVSVKYLAEKEKCQHVIKKECLFKKPSPKLSEKPPGAGNFNPLETAILNNQDNLFLVIVVIVFPEEIIFRVTEFIRKIFHVPNLYFFKLREKR